MKRIIIKVFDKFWVNGTDEKICLQKLMSEDFIITSCVLHYDSRLTFNRVDEFYK